jgi:hypothetical protein
MTEPTNNCQMCMRPFLAPGKYGGGSGGGGGADGGRGRPVVRGDNFAAINLSRAQ